MNAFNRIPYPIQWSEGMLLSPQHFQQQTLRFEHQLHHLMAQLSPFYWGILNLEIDPEKLVSGVFQVKSMEAVMPDGLSILYESGNDPDLKINLKQFEKFMAEKPITIYLAVPIRKPQAANPYAEVTRYESIEERGVLDENTGENETTLQRLKPKLSLIVVESGKFVTLPLARIALTSSGYSATRFIPPRLRISLDSPPGKEISNLLAEVREKATLLSGMINASGEALGEAVTLQHQRTIQHLVTELPALEVLAGSDSGHPLQIYQGLARLVGALAGLRPGLVPPILPDYNHNNFRPSLDEAIKFIKDSISIIQLSYSTLYFQKQENGDFILPFDKVWERTELLIGVVGQANIPEKNQIEWFNECIISSQSKTSSLKQQRALGATRMHVEKDTEMGIVPAIGRTLFKVRRSPEFFRAEEDLHVINSMGGQSSHQPPQAIVLYIPQKLPGAE